MSTTLEQHLIDEPGEMALLGAVLANPPVMGQVVPVVTADDFGIDRHRRIFELMHGAFVAGNPPDIYHVGTAMQRAGLEYFAPGYEAYLADLVEACPFTCYALHYAEAVADMAERRRFAQAVADSVTAVAKGGDVDRLISDTHDHLKAVSRPRQRGRYQHISEVDDDVFGEPRARWFFGGNLWPVDEIVGGMEAGQLVAIGARTSVGKTATLLQLLWTMAAVHGAPVGIVSLEMPARSLRNRLLGQIAAVNLHAMARDRRRPTPDEQARLDDAAAWLSLAPFYVDQEPRRSLDSVLERIRALHAEQRVEVVGVDYLQLLADTRKSENRTQELTRISAAMKQLAMELSIPIVCLAQLNRGADARDRGVPQLSDFKDSGAIEQDADIAILLSRDEGFKKRHLGLHDDDAVKASPRQFVRFEVAKNRNGATGGVVLEYRSQFTEFVPVVEGVTK